MEINSSTCAANIYARFEEFTMQCSSYTVYKKRKQMIKE